jgi:hypothetical protein
VSAYNRTYACARTRAIRSLIDTHREEYDGLLQSQLERRGIVTHEARRQSRRLAQLKMDDKRSHDGEVTFRYG